LMILAEDRVKLSISVQRHKSPFSKTRKKTRDDDKIHKILFGAPAPSILSFLQT
jgi:hypothetical protein